jgi:hypothetical protein
MKNLLESLKGWSKTAFIIAGASMAIFAILLTVYATTGNVTVQDARNIFGPAGFAFAFSGALGLYSLLSDQSPWLVRIATILAMLGIVGGVIISVGTLVDLVGIIGSRPTWVDGLSILIMAGMVGIALYGVVLLKTNTLSSTIGYLLIAPAAIFAVNFTRGIILGRWSPIWAPAVLAGMQTIAMLALGFSLPGDTSQLTPQQTQQPTAA